MASGAAVSSMQARAPATAGRRLGLYLTNAINDNELVAGATYLSKRYAAATMRSDMIPVVPKGHREFLGMIAMAITTAVALMLLRRRYRGIALARYWPLLLVVAGISNLVPPTNVKLVLDGLSYVFFGAWFYFAFEHIWGLTFGNSWPLLLIMWGVTLVLKPVLHNYFESNKEHYDGK
eukprot:gene38350-47347_t